MLANLIKLIGPILSLGKGSTTDTPAATDGFAALLEGTALPDAAVQPDFMVKTPGAETQAITTLPVKAAATVAVTDAVPVDPVQHIAFSLPRAPAMTSVPPSYRWADAEIPIQTAPSAVEADANSADGTERATPPAPVDWLAVVAERVTAQAPSRPDPVPSFAAAALLPPTKAGGDAEAPATPFEVTEPQTRSLPQPDTLDPDVSTSSVPFTFTVPVPSPAPAPDAAVGVPADPVGHQAPPSSSAAARPNLLALIAPGDRPGIAHALSTPVIRTMDALPPAKLATMNDASISPDDEIAGKGEIEDQDVSAPTSVLVDSSAIAIPLTAPVAMATAVPVSIPMFAPPPGPNSSAITIEATAGTPAALRMQVEQAFAPAQTMNAPTPPTPTTMPSSGAVSEAPRPAPAAPEGAPPTAMASASASPAEAASPGAAPLSPAAAAPAATLSSPAEVAPAKIRTWPIAAQSRAEPAEVLSPLKPASTTPKRGNPAPTEGTPASTRSMPAEAESRSTPERTGAAFTETDSSPASGPGKTAAVAIPPTESVNAAAAATAPAPDGATVSLPADTASPAAARRGTRAAAAQRAEAAPGTSEPVRRALSLLRVAEPGNELRVVARRSVPPAGTAPSAQGADTPVPASQLPSSVTQPASMLAAVPDAANALAAPAAPAVALADRIVDIGVSGQWIDRLAQEIATVAATDGTARFTLNPPALGAMQVEIRHSDAGAAIRMMVETEGALTALKDAQPQLRADASLAAIRIADIHVERRALPAEASSTTRDASQQQSQQSGRDSTGTSPQKQSAANPGGGAGQGQTAGQPYRKAPLIEATLNGPSGGRTDAEETGTAARGPRARYA